MPCRDGSTITAELAAHAIRVEEPQRVKGTEIFDATVTGAPLDQPLAKQGEGARRCSGECQVVEVTALEHA